MQEIYFRMGCTMILEKIKSSLRQGNSGQTRKDVLQALEEGFTHEEVLAAMLEEMEAVGKKFKVNELFVPEVLIIGRAFNVALKVLGPIVGENDGNKGSIVIGTVRGDLHDVGKNLVKMLMASTGVKVIDLGVDVPADKFVEAVRTHHPDMLAMSALLTTTMIHMKATIQAIEKAGLRKDMKIMIGGAPVTKSFADKVGADFFAVDAGTAAEMVRAFFANK